MKPIIKFPGGKTQLLTELRAIITPELLDEHTYYEPFVGGGALMLDLQHTNTVVNDLNSELINLYTVIRDEPEALIELLADLQKNHSKDLFYFIRGLDRGNLPTQISNVFKAARTIYLNKTCFNGLYRVNKKGYFNSPLGKTSSGKTPNIIQKDLIREMSKFLKTVQFHCGDYKDCLVNAKAGDVIFFDPPYMTAANIKTKGFVDYQKEGWTKDDLISLKAVCDDLVSKGCKVVITNNDTEFVRDLFVGYEIKEVDVKRSINRKGNSRKGKEVIIYKV
jgi:DNA adenine methylase